MRRIALGAAVCAATIALVAAVASDAQARTEVIKLRSEPFRLGGFRTIFPKVSVRTPRRDGYITRMDAWLIDPRGRRVTIRDAMLHHIVFINSGVPGGRAKTTSCPGRRGEPFWGTGEEKQPLLLPAGYGYRVADNDRWLMQAMLMSHDRKPHVVRIAYEMHIVTATRLQRVKPLWLRANGCSRHPSYDIAGGRAPGSVHSREHSWRMPFSGRIVAASAHMHGSAYGITIDQPRCGGRTLVEHQPRFGHPGDLVYRARPVLHEPGPIATGHLLSRTGIPVRKGERLRVAGRYDVSRPHPRVMAISHVYVAPDARAPRSCRPLPADAHIHWTRTDGRSLAPVVNLPLYGYRDGRVHEVERPPGGERVLNAPATVVRLRRNQFSPANLSVASGTRVTWRFDDRTPHNVTLVSGPDVVASQNHRRGRRYSKVMKSPGTYRLFCYLHPIGMTQVIAVRP